MLAGEAFSDHPDSVCPTIAAFLRAYNDLLDDAHRQDLSAYAAKVVGTHASYGAEVARAERIAGWASRRGRRARPRLVRWLSIETTAPGPEADHPGRLATSVAKGLNPVSDETHAEVLALVDELVAMGASEAAPTLTSQDEPGHEVPPPTRERGLDPSGDAVDGRPVRWQGERKWTACPSSPSRSALCSTG